MNRADLLVVVPFNNPMGWRSREVNMRRTEESLLAAGVKLRTVELAYGDRPFVLPDRDGVERVRLRTRDVFWHKENCGNIGLRGDWKFAAMVDGDLLFHDPDWAVRTLDALQLAPVVQISSDLVFLGPRGEHLGTRQSYIRRYRAERTRIRALDSIKYNINIPVTPNGDGYPGGAWGYRREAFDALGGLLDICIIGAGDQHMAWALTETPDTLIDPASPYGAAVQAWRDKAAKVVNRDVGLVSGLAFHLWHGKRADRRYPGRWKILTDNKFDPATDLTRDPQGLLALAGNKPHLRDDLKAYFGGRNEDSVDLDPPGVLGPDRRRGHHYYGPYGQCAPEPEKWWEHLEFWDW